MKAVWNSFSSVVVYWNKDEATLIYFKQWLFDWGLF